jgi:hypothetical protein
MMADFASTVAGSCDTINYVTIVTKLGADERHDFQPVEQFARQLRGYDRRHK